MIIMAVTGGVIVAGLAWAGWHDYRQRRRGARVSVTGAFIRQREVDRKKISENAGPDGGPGGI